MSLFGPPPGMDVAEAIHSIFSHYSSPFRSTLSQGDSSSEADVLSIDSLSFARMCKDAPDLPKVIGRHDVDLIFSRAKPVGERRLRFGNFLDALLELSMKLAPEDSPALAMATFLAKYIFALFDQPPAPISLNVVESIRRELVIPGN